MFAEPVQGMRMGMCEIIFILDIGAYLMTKIFDFFSDLIYQRLIALLGDFSVL